MKDIILTWACVMTLLLTGCNSFMFSHNANFVAKGKVFKLGAGDYGLLYVNGITGIQAIRENSEMVVESNDGDSFTNPGAASKGLCSISFRTGPQVTGYLVDMAKENGDAAIKYVENMKELNKAQWSAKQTIAEPTKVSSTKATEKEASTTSIGFEQIKEAATKVLDKLKGSVSGSTTIKGDGEYKNLYKDASIEAQAALTDELLKYADDETKMPNTGELIKDTLIHYAGRLAQLKAKGIKNASKITLRWATIKDGKITALAYRLYVESTKTYQDEECPNCFELEEK